MELVDFAELVNFAELTELVEKIKLAQNGFELVEKGSCPPANPHL